MEEQKVGSTRASEWCALAETRASEWRHENRTKGRWRSRLFVFLIPAAVAVTQTSQKTSLTHILSHSLSLFIKKHLF